MTRSALGRDDLQVQEIGSLIGRVLRRRWIITVSIAAFLVFIAWYEPRPWHRWALPLALAPALAAIAVDLRRGLRPRPYRLGLFPYDLSLIAIVQSGLILMTGGVESPLLVLYVVIAVLDGLAVRSLRAWVALVVLLTVLLWSMTLSAVWGWAPRTVPSFLGLGRGFIDRPVYLLIHAVVINLIVILGATAGRALARTYRRALDQTVAARAQVVHALSERNRELVQLSAAVAHELKNPLASISGLVQLLHRPGGDETRRAPRLEALTKEVARMGALLEEFLNFSRPVGELKPEPLVLGELFAEVTQLHEGTAHARRVRIVGADDPVPVARADRRKLIQALVNLLQNALDASTPGGRIYWVAARDGDAISIGVADEGSGVAPDLLPRLGQPGVTTKREGSGIGLAVVRAIAEQHGGQLLVENRPGGGCRAVLRLPHA